MIDRTTKGYYLCKIKDEEFYNNFMKPHGIYCTLNMLAKLPHNYSTQKNDPINHSVATLAHKTKKYSKTNSLRIRVMLYAGSQVVGYHDLWNSMFNKFNLDLDSNLAQCLKVKEIKKKQRQTIKGTKKYKAFRSTKRYNKFAELHKKTDGKYEDWYEV